MSNITLKYDNFLNESDEIEGTEPKKIFSKGEKKKMKLFISPELRSILLKMMKTADFQAKAVATKILNIDKEEDEENLFEISYIDIDKEKDDAITFLPAQRAWSKMGWKSQEEADIINIELFKAAGRQSLGVGKFINKLFDNFSEIAVNKFNGAYKAEIAATQIYDRFKLVTGEDIRFWYAEANYYRDPSGGGDPSLRNSCMRYDGTVERSKNTQSFLDIYVKNPDNCALLILTNRENKLLGRALVWKNLRKPTDKTFMDRIYVSKNADFELFKKYAQEQGWLYKYDQSAQDHSYMENGQRINKSIAVRLKPGEHKYYPYADTMKYYNTTTGRLGSDPGNPVEGTRRIKMESTTGGSTKID
jgi:hypothetical protein